MKMCFLVLVVGWRLVRLRFSISSLCMFISSLGNVMLPYTARSQHTVGHLLSKGLRHQRSPV